MSDVVELVLLYTNGVTESVKLTKTAFGEFVNGWMRGTRITIGPESNPSQGVDMEHVIAWKVEKQ